MKENQKRHTKRIRNLVITLVLTALILSVSTYAWFIGMKTVNVDEFSVQIAVAKDLLLSLNGEDWADTVSINKSNFNDTENTVYTGHTNWWAGEGLIPMSSIGQIDPDTSRLVLYEKASLTQSNGGYRIMASRAENNLKDEGGNYLGEAEGYVAFDLFIKNFSGADYIVDMKENSEEAIYLSVDSGAAVSDIGTEAENGVEGTGIENSVRVAFAQIGRVKATTTDVATITGISCATQPGVTPICGRTAQIWEPNDTAHVDAAINWYNTTCRPRTSKTEFTTDERCKEIANGTSYPTYAVGAPIDATAAVDVYDGFEFNGYTGSTTTMTDTDKLLVPYPYFTDTMKLKAGMERPEFFTLAPNSITKVRIYVFIEGQDVDNFDFASIGKAIKVKFGFTKQRLTGGDFGWEDPRTTTTTQP